MSTKKGISSLDYSQKKITCIPKEVLKNKDTLITLNISGNNFKDFNSIIGDLKQLKKLKNLKINIYTQEQAKTIIDAMPNLEYLNDEPINEDIASNKGEEEIVINIPLIKLVDIEFEPVFKKLNKFYNMNKTKEDNFQKLIEEFNNFGKKLKSSKNSDDNSNKTMKLYTFLNNKLNKIKEEANNKNNKYNKKSLALLTSIIEENNKIKNKSKKSKSKQKESEIKLDKENGNKKEETEENNSNNEKLTRNKNNLNNKNKNMKQNSFKSKQKSDINSNTYNSPSLEKKKSKDSNKIQPKEKEKENKNSKKLSKYPSSYGELSPKSNANNLFISNLPQHKKNDTLMSNRSFNKFNEKLKSPIDSAKKAKNHRETISEKKSKHAFLSINQRKKYKNQADLIENYNDQNITDLLMKNKTNYDTLNIFDDDNNEQIYKDKLNTRVINLNNLLEIINQVYKIRNSRNEKQKDGVYNKGTLEQDLYTYLKSKYGLKNLIVEWNINILSAVQTYIKLSGEVYLFALILRNELDEESIEIMNKIKKTVNNILYLIYDYDTKMIENVENNKEFMKEIEWKTISKCLYSDDDDLREKFVNKVINYIDKLMKGQDLMAKTGKKILFSDYMNILIYFNLKLRKKYLHNLFVLFSQQDKKRTGIINPESFRTIIKSCGIISDEEKVEEVANDLVEIADKEGSGQITFNDMVQCLDNLDLIMEEGKVKFLDKLSKMSL